MAMLDHIVQIFNLPGKEVTKTQRMSGMPMRADQNHV